MMKIVTTVCTLLMLTTFIDTVKGQSGDDVNALWKQLFVTKPYNKNVRPKTDQTKVMKIEVEFFLNSIIEFNEQEESITTAGFLEFHWIDEYLHWDPADHNDIVHIFMPQEDVWKPDVSLRNAYTSFRGLGASFYNLQIEYNGVIKWQPFQVLKSTCAVDITYFPFDTQSCDLKFIAWSYTKEEVSPVLGHEGIHTNHYSQNAAWELVGTNTREVKTNEAAVIFTIKLKRKPTFYIMNIALPVVLLTVLNVFTFALPASSGERNGFAITVFLALAVFLTIVASELPKNSDVVSVFGIYLTAMTSLSTLVVIACLLLTRLAARDTITHPIGTGFLFVHKMSQTMQCKRSCIRTRTNKIVNEMADTNEKTVDREENTAAGKEDLTWQNIVDSLDFLCFWFAIVFTFACTTILAAIAINN